jgi:hypothetical protein
VRGDDLAEVPVRGLSIVRELAIATRQQTQPTPATRAFIDMLHSSLDLSVAGL